MTETLTEYDRYDLEMIASGLPGHVVSRALRIIDAHQADREALELDRQRDGEHARDVVYDERYAVLEARLAAANALLDEWLTVDAAASSTPQRLLDRVHAHLAGQPAELPCVSGYVGSDGQCNDCGKHHAAPTRTEAEHRVLDAVRTVEQASLEYYVNAFGDETGWGAVSAAELARRGLK